MHGEQVTAKQSINGDGNHRFLLRSWFSDGAGSYCAEWLIVGKSSIRTVLTNDEWMFEYFDND